MDDESLRVCERAAAAGLGVPAPAAAAVAGAEADSVLSPRYDVERVRSHFDFPGTGRVVTNNAATSQTPRELIDLYRTLSPWYESIHRGQSAASRQITATFEESFDTIATWVNAPSRRSIATYKNTTEAINAVMYSLLTEFRDGDNVVTTLMEHNSNYVPWHALTHEVLPRLGRRVECRVARFDHHTGQLDLDHLAELVDHRTKLVARDRRLELPGHQTTPGPGPTDRHRQRLPAARRERSGSLVLVDAAQLAPTNPIDVAALDVDYLAFSFHKVLAPFGVGILYARETLLERSLPFLYGGDMIAEGKVTLGHVEYNQLPWKYVAGTPNVLGVIASAQALRLLVDLALDPPQPWFGNPQPLPRTDVETAMTLVQHHVRGLTDHALDRAQQHPRTTDLRTPTRPPEIAADGVQRPRPRPPSRRRRPGQPRHRSPRRLPLRHPGPPRPRPHRQLPTQLRRLHQPPRRRPRPRRPGAGGPLASRRS